ncbi:MAG TPA: hypothetical protein VIM70_16150 [Clostridium sp.]|uniref:hypothetical protein n=1 Tax=Clostridium sp. TaxID=1506 RepID=UPI002F93390B
MGKFVSFYILVQICLVIFAIIAFVIWDKRYRKNHGLDVPEGFEKTQEITIDPSDGRRLRVYYNSKTGERFYHEEKNNIPMLAKLEQLAPTQIQISYDRDVDVMKGMKPTNYWIKDTMNVIPQGIATLGRNDSVNAGNSLTGSKVRIDSKNGSAKTFILTFNRAIPSGAEYMLIICYVTVKGAPPYSGDNGKATFIGK